jgi:hypothetical protein
VATLVTGPVTVAADEAHLLCHRLLELADPAFRPGWTSSPGCRATSQPRFRYAALARRAMLALLGATAEDRAADRPGGRSARVRRAGRP